MKTLILTTKQIFSSRQICTIFFFLIISINQITAQIIQPIFKNLNKEFPEIDISVMDIHRDSRGYVWLAGKQNLQRFDGVNVKKYLLRDYPKIESIQILNKFKEDSRNNLWVYYLGMMLLYDPVFDDFHYFKFDLPDTDIPRSNLITAIEEDKKGNLWIAFANHHDYPIIRIHVDTLTQYVKTNPDTQFPIIITQDKFHYIPAKLYDHDEMDDIKAIPEINNILFDRNNHVWIERDGWVERYLENDTLKPGLFVRYLETRNDEGRILNRRGKNQERFRNYTFLDKNERLWVLTANRLYQFLDNSDQKIIPKDSIIEFFEFDHQLYDDFTVKFPRFYQSLYTDHKNNRNTAFQDIWINTYTLAPNLNYYLSFYFSKNNLLWLQRSPYVIDVYSMQFLANSRIEILKKNEFKSIPGDPCSWQFWLYPLFLDEEGILWSADRDRNGNIADGVLTLNTDDMNWYLKVYHSPSDPSFIPENEIGPIHKDYMGNTWFLPYSFRQQENILYLSNKDFSQFRVIELPEKENTPTGDFLHQIWEDIEHRMWFIGGRNIHVINLPAFYANKNPGVWHHQFDVTNFITAEKGDNIIVHDLMLDESGNLWMYAILYNDINPKRDYVWGLYYYNTDQLRNINFDQNKNMRFHKFDQFKNPGDTLHFGSYNTDVLKYWDTWKPEFDHHNRNYVYLLSNTALIRIDPESKEYDIFDSGNPNPSISFSEITNGTFITYDSAKDSVILFGTLNTGGLVSYTFYDMPEKKDLKSKKIYVNQEGYKYNSWRLLSDEKNNLWSLTDNQGLLKYIREEDRFTYFTSEYTRGKWSYCGGHYIDKDGFMYLQSSDGIIIFHPDSIKENSFVPPVNISDINVLGKSIIREKDSIYLNIIYTSETLKIPYHQNDISIDFNSMSLQNVKNNQYKYRLEGWNQDWISPGSSNRTSSYSNLSPGSYTFRVKGSNNDGVWNEEGASLDIIVLPPWWLTWWAKGAYVLLFIGSIWGFIYLRTRQQKKELENVKRINTRLQQIDKLRDQFLANTSHELRTPLHGIIGLSESLMDGVSGKLSNQVTDILRMITTSGKRLSYLINDILDFARLKNQELTLQLRPVDLHSAADVVLTLATPLVRNKEVVLINEVLQDIPLVEVDENRLQQILQNLVGNAIKFTDKGEVKISADEMDNKIAITISDTGIGIPEEKWDDIFNAFEQADGTTAREYGGTGIGLSITKQLVELHGGEIWLNSKVGEGSQFSFTLPLSKTKRKDKPEMDFARGLEETKSIIEIESVKEGLEEISVSPLASIPEPDQIKILVVDDEPVNLEVLKNHLSLAGYQVTLANNGLEAMEIIQKGESFDLIILDIMMPKMSGYEVCNKLRDIYMPSELPVVLLTAKNRISNLVDGFNAGANDYLTKPFSKDELLSRIKTHLHLHRINKVTGKFVPYEFLKFIGRESIMDVKLGDQREQEVSVLFTDIRDYTTLSEDMTPDENFRFINSFAGRMGPIIHQHKGFINQYMGDAIMAIFPRDVKNGLNASIEMQRGIIDYNEYRQKKGRKGIEIGIGFHTGPLMMGIIGDQNRTEPATIADTVNIASRMEGMTKYYGIKILISQDSHNILAHPEEYHFRYMGEIVVKGKNLPIKVYECFDGDVIRIRDKKLESLKQFEEGLAIYYNKEFPEASVIFNHIAKENPSDKAASYFYNKAVTYALKGVPDDWTGVEKMEMK